MSSGAAPQSDADLPLIPINLPEPRFRLWNVRGNKKLSRQRECEPTSFNDEYLLSESRYFRSGRLQTDAGEPGTTVSPKPTSTWTGQRALPSNPINMTRTPA